MLISLCLVVLFKSDVPERLAPFFHMFFFFVFCPSAGASSTETAQGTLCTSTKRPRDSGTLHLLSLPPALLRLPHFFHAHPHPPPFPDLFSPLSSGLGERGDARETATDRREGGRRRGGPRDTQAEEPPALLSLPNQTRAGAAGTGLLSLWSVPTHRSRDLIAPTATPPTPSPRQDELQCCSTLNDTPSANLLVL